MTIKGILFDKDGTLIDFERSWGPIIRICADQVAGGDGALSARLLGSIGVDGKTGDVAPGSIMAAGDTYDVARAWIAVCGAGDEAALVETLDGLFETLILEHVAPVTDLDGLLSALKGDALRLGVATNASVGEARSTLAHLKITDHFDFIAGYDSGFGSKPGPGMVHGFCEAVALEPGDVAVVGDNFHDLEMGRRAGAGLLIGVLTGTSARADLAPHADHVIENIADMPALLEG